MRDVMLAEYLLDQEAREREAKEAAEVRAWVLGTYGCPSPPSDHFGPADLQRVFRSLSWNRACSILEMMELDGEIVCESRAPLTFLLAPKAANPTRATAEVLAAHFHRTYEKLAPRFGYETRPETREWDPASPNGRLMVAVCQEVLANLMPGYSPPLSPKEHGALLRLLDERLAIDARIKAAAWEDDPLAQALEEILKADLSTLRAIRARMGKPLAEDLVD